MSGLPTVTTSFQTTPDPCQGSTAALPPEVAQQLTCDSDSDKTCNALAADYGTQSDFRRVCADKYPNNVDNERYVTCRSLCEGPEANGIECYDFCPCKLSFLSSVK